jgi:hypothetical protein
MEVSAVVVKGLFFLTCALVALVIADVRWFGPWRAKRRGMKLERSKS